MPSPFPGMDPYLENPELWPDVHHELISEIRTALNPSLRPHYVARVELRVYISDEDDPGRETIIPDVRVEQRKRRGARNGRPQSSLAVAEPTVVDVLIDDEIKEARVEIKHLKTGALITVIELLSPTNKVRGARGRGSFLEKRQETLSSDVHWVEIDLLRGGLPSVNRSRFKETDYRILVSRAERRSKFQAKGDLWAVGLRQKLPVIGIPLRAPDPDVPLDLAAVLSSAYDRAAYDLSIDYGRQPVPPLKGADASWADRLLRERDLR